jgi:hypothetical protein
VISQTNFSLSQGLVFLEKKLRIYQNINIAIKNLLFRMVHNEKI